jgi:hypothetical protein
LSVDTLPVFTCEVEIAEGVDCHISDGPLHGREVVEGLEEAGYV